MSDKILVTDSLFIFDEHVKQMEAAGFEVERLDNSKATEEEMCVAIKGKVGYILGGLESVTDKVIEAADELRAISFTGADWNHFIPGSEAATKKGIAITNTPGGNSDAVAEMSLTFILVMARDLIELSRIGDVNFKTVPGLQNMQVGILGMGHIGKKVAKLLKGIGVTNVVYWNRHRYEDIEAELEIKYLELDELFRTSDIISNHVSTAAGTFVNAELINAAKKDTIFFNMGGENSFDYDALREKLLNSDARFAFDLPNPPEQMKDLPVHKAFYTKANAGFNTMHALKQVSDMAVSSLLNVLQTGKDQYKVN